MRKVSLAGLICCLFFALAALSQARAQTVSPWFRGTAKSWQTLKTASFTPVKIAKIPLVRPMSGAATGLQVKTTVPNWLKYRLSHSGTLSKMEKGILQIHPNNPVAVAGKLSYFWDRDALLAQSAAAGEINPNALARHQELLQNTLAETEAHWKEEIAGNLHAYALPPQETLNLLADASQPPAYILTRREMEFFPTLTLSGQRQFVRRTLEDNTQKLSDLLAQDPEKIPTYRYADYYHLKLRARYFTLLERVVSAAQTPRTTLIIRVKKQVPLSFLPQSEESLTDAQRLGKLYFYAEQLQTSGISEQTVALQTEIARQEKLYGLYAQAEAFSLPYETVLKRPNTVTAYALGAEEAEQLNMLPNSRLAEELPELIRQAQAHKNAFGAQAAPGPDFYVHYFRLHLKESILRTRLARARFFLTHNL